MLTTILIMLLSVIFILFSVLLYLSIMEKQLDKKLLEEEREQRRIKLSNNSHVRLINYVISYKKSKRKK